MAKDEEKLAEEARRKTNGQDTPDTVKGEGVDKPSSQVEEATMDENDKTRDLDDILADKNVPYDEKVAAIDKEIKDTDNSLSGEEKLYNRSLAKNKEADDAFMKVGGPIYLAGLALLAVSLLFPPLAPVCVPAAIGLFVASPIVCSSKKFSTQLSRIHDEKVEREQRMKNDQTVMAE